ncbi:putative 7-carboxy-7-deazaguanine synthase QueE [Clostridium sp. E02]|uniref:putative 7-carboxy-7-deazaguanine synthase QueE n=1 Tax=Clostridium sp. E02 TaxID=2487134 RepID=UPI000F53AB53|nr:putative 7-carboxy-7-deazaguanine synthase QueE [Clostridium sp. E02]
MAEYKIAETFVSLNGEGKLAGQLAVFIRFAGCNLSCSYCDTAWANQERFESRTMSDHEIYHYIKETGIKNVTLTGGEPMIQPEIGTLLSLLTKDVELKVEVETNGSVDLSEFLYLRNPPSFTMDYKLPGSCMESAMQVTNFSCLTSKDMVKFVVGSLKDLDRTNEMIIYYNLTQRCSVSISAVFGQIGFPMVVEYMKRHRMNGVNFQLQLHKFIWEPDTRGV